MFDSIRALSSRQQVFLALGTACVLCLVLGAVWFFALRTDWTPLFTQLRPSDAATIVADLDRKKIAYRLADGGTAILVPADQADSARLDVMTGDLPLKGTVGFELFNKSDVGLTDFAQKINYQRALQGELERTIMTLDGINSARVHLSLGEDRIFRDDRVPPKASVTIRMRKGSSAHAAGGAGRAAAHRGLGAQPRCLRRRDPGREAAASSARRRISRRYPAPDRPRRRSATRSSSTIRRSCAPRSIAPIRSSASPSASPR